MSGNLVSGGTKDPFLPELLRAIRKADEIDLAVAFIKSSGLDLVFGGAVGCRDHTQCPTARVYQRLPGCHRPTGSAPADVAGDQTISVPRFKLASLPERIDRILIAPGTTNVSYGDAGVPA